MGSVLYGARPVPPSYREYRLPRGRHGLPPDQVAANQRWRLLGACAEVLRQRGYASTTISNVTGTAAVSKAAFYRNFDGLPSCILATFELATEGALTALSQSCLQSPGPPDLAEAVSALLDFLEAEPALGYVLTDSALDDVPGIPIARARFTDRCCSMLATARGNRGEGDRRVPHLVRGMQGWLSMRLEGGPLAQYSRDLAGVLAL